MTEENEKGRIEKDDAQEATNEQTKERTRRALTGGVAAAALVAACAVGAIVGQAFIGQEADQRAKPAESQQALQSAASPSDAQAEEHVWKPMYSVVHVDKQTHVEHRDATYKQETVSETVCNDCKAVITGKAQEHIEKTGHSGFTRGVPVLEDVLDAPAQDVEVTDREAHDEYRLAGYACECGKMLTLDEAKEAGVYSEADEYQAGNDAAAAKN